MGSHETEIRTSVETAFQDPTSFIPERWTSRPELILDKRAFAPFGVGKYKLRLSYMILTLRIHPAHC